MRRWLNPSVFPAVLAFFLPAFILFLAFQVEGVFPAGDRHILTIDLFHQYAPFLAEYRRKLLSFDTLLYSWQAGLGVDFYAIFAYYLASPINVLLVLFPESQLPTFVLFAVVLKTGLAGLTTHFYLTRGRGHNPIASIMFAMGYALSSFTLAYFWNIMWLDVLVLLPVLAYTMVLLVRERRLFPYALVLGLTLFTNYYAAFFAVLFSVLYFVVLLIENSVGTTIQDQFARVGRFFIGSAIGGLASSIVVIPAYLKLQATSASADSWPEKLEFLFSPLDLFSRMLVATEPAVREGLPNVYAGALVLLLVPLYMAAKQIPARARAANSALLGILFLSLAVNSLNFFWHGMHYPNQLPHRFAFVVVFLLVVMAADAYHAYVRSGGRAVLITAGGVALAALVFQKLDAELISARAHLFTLIAVAIYAGVLYGLSGRESLTFGAKKTVSEDESSLDSASSDTEAEDARIENGSVARAEAAKAPQSANVQVDESSSADNLAVSDDVSVEGSSASSTAGEGLAATGTQANDARTNGAQAEARQIEAKSDQDGVRGWKGFTPKKKPLTASALLAGLLVVFVSIELTGSTMLGIRDVREGQVFGTIEGYASGTFPDEIRYLRDQIKADNPGHYPRTELMQYRTYNDGFLYGYDGVTAFASTFSKDRLGLLADLGLSTNNLNSYAYNSTKPLDSFLGVKYVLDRQMSDPERTDYPSYYKGVEVRAYENPDALDPAFFVPSIAADFHSSPVGYFDNQNSLYQALFSTPDVFDVVTAQIIGETGTVEDRGQTEFGQQAYIETPADAEGGIEIRVVAPQSGHYYMGYKHGTISPKAIHGYYSPDADDRYHITAHRDAIVDMGYLEAGSTGRILIRTNEGETGTIDIQVGRLNETAYQQAMTMAKSTPVQIEERGGRSMKLHVNATQPGYVLLTSIWDPDWKAKVNGEPVELKPFSDSMILVPVEAGDNDIALSYRPAGLVSSTILTVVALILIVLMAIAESERGRPLASRLGLVRRAGKPQGQSGSKGQPSRKSRVSRKGQSGKGQSKVKGASRGKTQSKQKRPAKGKTGTKPRPSTKD